MKFQIVVDSSSDIKSDFYKSDLVSVKVVPLAININQEEFIDNDSLDTNVLLQKMSAYNGKQTTSCPAPSLFENHFKEAEYNFCITISSKLSGTYNAANVAKAIAEADGHNVHVFDSKAVSGVEKLMVEDIIRYIEAGKSYEEIIELVKPENYHLLFVLSSFDNLIKNGRMNKFTGIVASLLSIKPLFVAHEGEIKLLKKVRTLSRSLASLIDEIEIMAPTINEGGKIIISHCNADSVVEKLKSDIEGRYKNALVEVIRMHGLTSFYAQENGIIVSFSPR